MNERNFYAVVMAGGRGERFWPLGRRRRPKQLLNLMGDRSMLEDTVLRLFPMFAPENPLGGDAIHSANGEFKGHLIYGIAEYSFTKHIKTHAVIETIMPGNFYTPDYRATALFIRGQVFLTW